MRAEYRQYMHKIASMEFTLAPSPSLFTDGFTKSSTFKAGFCQTSGVSAKIPRWLLPMLLSVSSLEQRPERMAEKVKIACPE